uniref:Uncharacterized protein n=1 Tax=Chrysotila carterae TaxID=13221 RepID=A0A7S4EVE4_CHRCT
MCSSECGEPGHCSDAGRSRLSQQQHDEDSTRVSPNQNEGNEDVTAWRASLVEESAYCNEEETLDERVEGALLALNEAIAQNNAMQASYTNAAQTLYELQRAAESELEDLKHRHWLWIDEIATFESNKREIKVAAAELSRISHALLVASEEEATADEALGVQKQLRETMSRDDADGWEAMKVVKQQLRARRDSARARVSKLSSEQRHYSNEVSRLTEKVLSMSYNIGSAFENALPFLSVKQSYIEKQQEQHLELVQQLERAEEAKARVRDAMRTLEEISMEIHEQRRRKDSSRSSDGADADDCDASFTDPPPNCAERSPAGSSVDVTGHQPALLAS